MKRHHLTLAIATALAIAFSSCGEKTSARFTEMKNDVENIKQQIGQTESCDELQLLYFGILGLRTDLTSPEEEGGLSETEFENMSNMINDLEVMLNTKYGQFDCFNTDSITNDIDTAEEDFVDDYNLL